MGVREAWADPQRRAAILAARSQSWSDEEHAILEQGLVEGLSYVAIAVRVGRSELACRKRADRLGIGRSFRAWTEDQIRFLRDNAGLASAVAMAATLGRTEASVRYKLSELGIEGKLRGSSHPSWRGGSQKHLYSQAWKKSIRPAVFERDGYTCLECGLFSPGGLLLKAHHIIPFRFTRDNRLSNHATLCIVNHGQQVSHWWEEYWLGRENELPTYQQMLLGTI